MLLLLLLLFAFFFPEESSLRKSFRTVLYYTSSRRALYIQYYCSSQEVNSYEMPLKCKAGNAKVMYFVIEHNSKLLGAGVSDI